MDPFRQTITVSSICNEVFRTMFLKPDSVGIIPSGGYRMGDRQSIEALQWLAYIGRTRENIVYAGNGRGVHLPGVSYVKFHGYCAETNEVFEYHGCFGMGVLACPIDTNPLARLTKHCRIDVRKLRRGCRKSRTPVIMFRSCGVSIINCCVKLLPLKINFAPTPM